MYAFQIGGIAVTHSSQVRVPLDAALVTAIAFTSATPFGQRERRSWHLPPASELA
jgi:hypothetical protein